MWGWFGLGDRTWVAPLHRWSGRLAVLATLPVVTHCLYAFGFEHDNPRVLAHSLLGCLFFGAFTAKMLALRPKSVPGWALPAPRRAAVHRPGRALAHVGALVLHDDGSPPMTTTSTTAAIHSRRSACWPAARSSAAPLRSV